VFVMAGLGVGRPNLVADFDDALRRTREILDT
jgi:hypothetical protein